jgi:hypothetical protein
MARDEILAEQLREQILSGKASPEYPEDFGFYYSENMDIIKQCVNALELFKEWPEPGGLLDQDYHLVADMITYQQIRFCKRAEYRRSDDG